MRFCCHRELSAGVKPSDVGKATTLKSAIAHNGTCMQANNNGAQRDAVLH